MYFSIVRTSHRHSASLLLVLLVAGGLVAPSVHRVQHAQERAHERMAHRLAGHHHHALAEAHGLEVVEPCPEPLTAELACVLCKVLSDLVWNVDGAWLDRPPVAPHEASLAQIATDPLVLERTIRGPPDGRVA